MPHVRCVGYFYSSASYHLRIVSPNVNIVHTVVRFDVIVSFDVSFFIEKNDEVALESDPNAGLNFSILLIRINVR